MGLVYRGSESMPQRQVRQYVISAARSHSLPRWPPPLRASTPARRRKATIRLTCLRPSASLPRLVLAMPVSNHSHFFHRDQSLVDPFVQVRDEALDSLCRVDDLDHHREVFGKPQDLRGVDAAMRPEAEYAAQHRRPGHAALARLFDNHLVQWPMRMEVAFADKNSDRKSTRL